ncbi:ABC transporter substrate-binding protein [Rhodococcus sp. NPDC003318]|uniref:ABC transporter substrate-binding protein n=1 Tax=Rhodococcus sp. NPDC003318 TaxID=3364503 RepID=UPI0036C3FB0F
MFTTAKKLVVIGVAGALVCGAAGCGSDSPSDSDASTIKIGFIGSLTGPLSSSGKVSLDGLTAGADYIAEHYPGSKVEIVQRDTKGEPTAAVAATRALAQENVSALYYTTEAFPAVQDVLNQVEVPASTAGGIGPILNDVGDSNRYKYAFSTGAGTAGETSVIPLLEYAAASGNPVAMLNDSSAYNTAQAELTASIVAAKYPQVELVTQSFPTTASDVTAQLNKLRDSGAKSIIVWSYGSPLVAVMSSLSKIGWNPRMAGVLGVGDPAAASLIPAGMKDTLAAGPMAKTFLSTSPGASPSGVTAEFVDRFRKASGKDDFVALDTVGATSFDWVLLVHQASENSHSADPNKIKDALVSGEPFDGANGTYVFGPDQRIGIGADQLATFLPAQPCTNGTCASADLPATS